MFKRVSLSESRSSPRHLFLCLFSKVLILDYLSHDSFCILLLAHSWVKEIQEISLWVNQKYSSCMINLILPFLFSFLIVNFLCLYLILAETLLDLYAITSWTSNSDDLLTELGEIILHDFGRVSLWIDWNKYYFEFHVGSFRNISDDSINWRNVVKSAWADVRTAGISEINHIVVPVQISTGERPAFSIDQGPVPSEFCLFRFYLLQTRDIFLEKVKIFITARAGII